MIILVDVMVVRIDRMIDLVDSFSVGTLVSDVGT